MVLPVMPPVRPMLAKAVPDLPIGDIAYEAKWDGFRCIVFRDGDDVVLGSRNEKPLTRYFPEILDPLRDCLPEQCVVDGELIVAIDNHLAFDALQQRIHPAESRVNTLAAETPAEFVAFDLLALGTTDLMNTPFQERRAALEQISGPFTAPIHLAPMTMDPSTAMEWFHDFEGAGLDGLIAKPLDGAYAENKRTQFKVKHVRTADAVVAGYRIHKDGQGVGSLLLGLHDESGRLHHVGVAASFTAKRRTELLTELEPYLLREIDAHPWADWIRAEAHQDGRMPGAPHRWSTAGGKDHRWIPLEPTRVAEIKYESVLNGRFRATTRFLRWRDDRNAASCRYDQLEEVVPYELRAILPVS